VGALVNDKALYNNLSDSTADLQKTMVQAQAGVTDFQENMEALKHNFFLAGYYKKRGYEDTSELAANKIGGIPQTAPLKTFSFSAKDLFDGRNSAKLKNQKTLRDVGDYLAQNQFGVAVIVASTGMEGDSKKDLVLNEARAMVIREYLVENFGFDDTLLKTLGLVKQAAGINLSEWGTITIDIFPTGTQIPSDSTVQSSVPSATGPSVTSAANTGDANQASQNHPASKQ
jgi:outer membrane protein OmpA-like peptidoglycan-associated protein